MDRVRDNFRLVLEVKFLPAFLWRVLFRRWLILQLTKPEPLRGRYPN